MQLVLASTRATGAKLLERLGIPFSVTDPGLARNASRARRRRTWRDASPRRNRWRSQAAFHDAFGSSAAIRVAVGNGEVLGKTRTRENAVRQLRALSGREAVFYTAVCVHNTSDGSSRSASSRAASTFRKLDGGTIEHYLAREQPYDCAGSAKAEGLGNRADRENEGEDPNALVGFAADRAGGSAARARVECPLTAEGHFISCPTRWAMSAPEAVIPTAALDRARSLDYIIAEDPKAARAFLKRIAPTRDRCRACRVERLDHNTKGSRYTAFPGAAPRRQRCGTPFRSRAAGCRRPGSEPGALAHEKGVRVVPLSGPSSILLALSASGLDGQRFAFHGYLPIAETEARFHIERNANAGRGS